MENQYPCGKRKRVLSDGDEKIILLDEDRQSSHQPEQTTNLLSPITLLSKDEWGLIVSFLELGHGNTIDRNLPLLLTCRRISELLDWKLILRNIWFGEALRLGLLRVGSKLVHKWHLNHVLTTLHGKEGIGREVFEVILTNGSVVPELLLEIFIVAMEVNEFRWDWERALGSCSLPKEDGLLNINMIKATNKLYKTRESLSSQMDVIDALLENPTCSEFFRNNLLQMAVDENLVDIVPIILDKDDRYFDGVLPLVLLSSALIKERGEIATILQNDERVSRRIIPCSICNENPSCVDCMNYLDGKCLASPLGTLPTFYCKPCRGDFICMVCQRHMCQECWDGEVKEMQYGQCATCSNIACRNCRTDGYTRECYVECANFELCGKVQCVKCLFSADVVDKKWNNCISERIKKGSLPHWFCDGCSPPNTNYCLDPSVGGRVQDDGKLCCPACIKGNVRKCLTCGLVELNSIANSEGWFVCPTLYFDHMYCRGCCPSHDEGCPACKNSN